MSFLCRYCGREREEAQRSPDHVLQAAIGSALIEPDVCHGCNQRADAEVDRVFVQDFWMRVYRHEHRVRDRYGKTTPAPVEKVELEDGTQALAIFERGNWHLRMLPSEEWLDETTFRIGVDSTEADEVFAKKLHRLERVHGEVEVGAFELERSQPRLYQKYALQLATWPRFGAKVALALAPYALGAEWLRSDVANGLRATLWNKEDWGGVAPVQLRPHWSTMSDDDLGRFFVPPEHFVAFVPSPHGVLLHIVLFGRLFYGVPLGGNWPVREQAAWWLDPVKRSVERTTWPQAMARVAVRLGGTEAA